MIKIRRILVLLLVLLCVGLVANAQNYTREGNTFVSTKTVKAEPMKTKFIWKDSKGKEYPVYISSNGSCFVIKVSAKTGKDYRNYLGPEISKEICKELGIECKSKKGK